LTQCLELRFKINLFLAAEQENKSLSQIAQI
jgi:hypothetical protein